MYRITFVLGPEEPLLRQALNTLLAALTMIDMAEFRARPSMPPLYQSKVRYEGECGSQDDWQDAFTTHRLGKGDCEDLACLRAAELRVRQGVDVWPNVNLQKTSIGGLSYHTKIAGPGGLFEDPAMRLGLPSLKDHHCTGLGVGKCENRITFVLDLFKGAFERPTSHRVLQLLLHSLMLIDIAWLRAHPEAPNLYDAGVRYVEEPPGREEWQDVHSTLHRREGDCEDLATHRAAELIVRKGVKAWPTFIWKERPSGNYLYHILTRYQDPKTGEVRTEDPSKVLGMRGG
jgi:hypothetical protein